MPRQLNSLWTRIAFTGLLVLLFPLSFSTSPANAEMARIDPQVIEQGETVFWVVLNEQADLSQAFLIQDWNARGQYVYDQLTGLAESSQAGLRSFLDQEGASYTPFWIYNTIRVTGDSSLIKELATRPEVDEILPAKDYPLPDPEPGVDQDAIQAIEWNIDRVRAPEVWNTFGVRGEGIVVANIDTGVQYDHPALIAQYRGNEGGGVFDHNYDWFDPSLICGSPSLVPCDNVDHGTHTMGTMVGDDGGANQIGVAPAARWIAAKGCESNFCSDFALLASAQWVLAPTDLNGQNPRPDLRPQAVNNSWGGGGGDPWYLASVQAWIASGIFPAFSNGNSGPGCGSSGSPGDYVESYAAGAFDINNNIADFSSRGPSAFAGEIKPNIAAPGVDVRSSIPGNGYAAFSGTSMASPHVAGTVALMWSAAPALFGDIAGTRALLDQAGIDTEDLSCGGDAADNNVWGEGRLDTFAAVDLSPRGPTGTLQGTVTDTDTSLPISGALIQAEGPSNRTTLTDANGQYSFLLPVGFYDVTASAFGYFDQIFTAVEILEDQTTIQDFTLDPAPSFPVSGTVQNDLGEPIANATVTILGTPIPPATTDASGFYSFPSVPAGTYDVSAQAGGCNDSLILPLVVDGPETLDFTLPIRVDAFGYFCEIVAPAYIEATDPLGLSGDDNSLQVNLPFPFTFYGQTYNSAHVATNGFLNFQSPNANFVNEPIPSPNEPNAAIYPFWDDLFVDSPEAAMYTQLLGEAPNRTYVIEWRNVTFFADFVRRIDFEVVLNENGHILAQYRAIDPDGREKGNSATIGLENEDGSIALQYSFNQASVGDPEFAVLYQLPPSGFVEGHVTDTIDGLPIAGATVTALEAGRSVTTDADGFYRMQLEIGTHTLEASAPNYVSEQAIVEILLDQTITQDFSLDSARAVVDPTSLEFIVLPDDTETQSLTLSNVGLVDLTFEIGEVPGLASLGNATLGSAAAAPPSNSDTAPAGYTPQLVEPNIVGLPTLVFMDALPWGTDALLQVLNANGIPFDVANSSQMGTIDLSPYTVVFISSDQPQNFYNAYNTNLSRFEDYVVSGGLLWVGASAWGFNGGDFNNALLPGGARVQGPVFEEINDVVDPSHPIMQGVPDPFFGTFASHAAFVDLPAGASVIADGQSSGLSTLIEYDFGAGRVLAFGQTLEFGFAFGQDSGIILENGVPYAYAFVPVLDIPWLSEEPVSGTVPPGASQEIQVTVDTTGLEPGVYLARLLFTLNDPRNPRLFVPVTLIVPAFQQLVNTGGGAYTDLSGEVWAADQAYVAGSWGYVGAKTTAKTGKPISGTEDDPLYQDARRGQVDYLFDGLAPGVYQVELRFAEIQNQGPGQRLFDVIIEGGFVLPAHDIAAEVGKFAADDHTFFIAVTDGQLQIRFIPRLGFKLPLINAIRVIHRPDM